MKTRFKKWLIPLFILVVSFNISTAQNQCIDSVYVSIESELINGQVHVHFNAYNFQNILSTQFSLKYDSDVLQFDELLDDSNLDVSINSNTPGLFPLLFFSTTGLAFDHPNGESLFTMVFNPLDNINTLISIVEDPLAIEIASEEGLYCLGFEPTLAIISGAKIEGYVQHDADLNCNFSVDEQGVQDWIVLIENDNYSFFTDTDENGYYSIIVPEGTYDVNVEYRNNLWTGCSGSQSVNAQDIQETYTADFLVYGELECVDLYTSVSSPFLRRCFNNTYTLRYSNEGTVVAEDAQVTFNLDEHLTFVSTDAPNYTISGNQITFEVGDLEALEHGSIKVEVYVECETTVLGQTHCVTAEITPNDPCFVDPNWSGASIELNGYCDGDSVRFTITNTGIENMAVPSEFIVVEDDVMIIESEIQLPKGTSQGIALFADGSTFRLSANQVSNHPNNSRPTIALEGCTEGSDFSTGFVTMFEPGDQSNNIDIDCQENIGSFDPNDKTSLPKGYRAQHYIKANTDLEYKIRFQNTGTDTAFRVIVKDQLDPSLDLCSLELGASSHPYTFTLEEDRTMVFKFDNIYLVDSTTNEPASHGFVKFNIKQLADLNDGTSIYNSADIYFDFNEAIKTNIVDHIIGSDFVEVGISSVETFGTDIEFEVYPNPASDYVNIKLDVDSVNNPNLQVFDNVGKLVLSSQLVKGHNQISLGDLTIGNYYFLVKDGSVKLASGKLSLVSAY